MINFFKIYQIANVDGITMKIFMGRLTIPRYYKSIPIEIGEVKIKEARMEMLERVDGLTHSIIAGFMSVLLIIFAVEKRRTTSLCSPVYS